MTTEAGAAMPSDGAEARVLVVDDTPANVRLLAGILKIAGCEVHTASGGAEALALLPDVRPDVVLLDVMMPDMDGFEVCRRVKAASPSLPVVMVTALHETPDRVRALEAGADDFLTKPVDETEVVARVHTLTRAKRQRDALEAAYADLRRAESLRDSLTAMLVHDLRTPLTGIIGPLEMLTDEADGPLLLDAGAREMLDICRNSAYQLLGMVNDLLDISKMEAGELRLERSPVAPADLVDEGLTLVTPLAHKKQIVLVREVAPGLPALSASRDLLRRVLVNLVGNALKFTPPQGVVTISARPAAGDEAGSGAVVFAVRDTGEGIPEDAFGRIFEKFGQVETRRQGRTMSTGLGLTFCKMAVEAHGGRIWVESELKRGSTFYFTIPTGRATE